MNCSEQRRASTDLLVFLLGEELLAFHGDFCSIEVLIVLSVGRSIGICGQDL